MAASAMSAAAETGAFRCGGVAWGVQSVKTSKKMTLSVAEKALSVDEIAKAAKITKEETLLGMGWLLKEGKIKGEDNKFLLA